MEVRIVLELLTSSVPALSLAAGQAFTFPANISFRGPRQLQVDWPARSGPAFQPSLSDAEPSALAGRTAIRQTPLQRMSAMGREPNVTQKRNDSHLQ
jgi:hypothetical protein